MKQQIKRLLSLVLTALVVVSMTGMNAVFATGSTPAGGEANAYQTPSGPETLTEEVALTDPKGAELVNEDTLKVDYTYLAKVHIQGERTGLDGVTATLQQNGTMVEATSTNGGYISFSGLPTGTYTLELSKDGYFTSTETITIPTTGLPPVFYIKPDLQIPPNLVAGSTKMMIDGVEHTYQELPSDDALDIEVLIPHADWYSMGEGYLSTYSPYPSSGIETINVCFADYIFLHDKSFALRAFNNSLSLQIKGENKISSSTATTLFAGRVKLTGSGTLTLEGGVGILASSIDFNDFYGVLNALFQLSAGTGTPSIYNSTGAVRYNSKTPLTVTDQDRLVIFPESTLTIAPGSILDLSTIPVSNWAKCLQLKNVPLSSGKIVNNGTIKIAGTQEAFLAAYGGKISGNGTIETTTLPSYDVTVIGGTSSPSKAEKGETVTITATAPAGQQFKEWKLEPAVPFTDDTYADFERARFTMPDEAVKATAVFEPIQVSIINVRVSPKPIQVQQGTTQQFFATVRGTSTFDNTVTWTVTGGKEGTSISEVGVLTVAADESATSLTVTATANGDPLKYDTASVTVATTPVTKYKVTVKNGTGSATYEPGNDVVITATVPAGQKFKTWTVKEGSVWLVDAQSVSTRFTMPPEDVMVTASFEDISHSHSGNPCTICGYSYSTSGGATTPPKTETITNPDGSTTKTETTTKTDSTTGAKVETKTETTTAKDGTITKIETTTISGGKDGLTGTIVASTNAAGQVTTTITLTTKEGSTQVQLPAAVTEAAKRGETITTQLSVGGLRMTLDAKSLKAILSAGGSAPVITVTPVAADKLPEGIRSATAFDFQVGGKGADFGGGSVTVSVSYTKKDSDKSICVYFIKPDGNMQRVPGATFENGTVTFSQSHWSVYAIVEETPPPFTDVAETAWYYDAVRWAAEQKVLTGTSSTVFSPNTSVTRGMFMTALGRLAGIDTTKYTNTKFSDVPANAYYASYVAWAAEKGITSGATATTFAPDRAITRQEMAVIMQNYAKAMGYTAAKPREATIFADSQSIGAWAKDAVAAMQMAGIMNGKDGNRFDPTGTATRAEVAAVLQRYVELVVDV